MSTLRAIAFLIMYISMDDNLGVSSARRFWYWRCSWSFSGFTSSLDIAAKKSFADGFYVVGACIRQGIDEELRPDVERLAVS